MMVFRRISAPLEPTCVVTPVSDFARKAWFPIVLRMHGSEPRHRACARWVLLHHGAKKRACSVGWLEIYHAYCAFADINSARSRILWATVWQIYGGWRWQQTINLHAGVNGKHIGLGKILCKRSYWKQQWGNCPHGEGKLLLSRPGAQVEVSRGQTRKKHRVISRRPITMAMSLWIGAFSADLFWNRMKRIPPYRYMSQ